MPATTATPGRPPIEERMDGLCDLLRARTGEGKVAWEREETIDQDRHVVRVGRHRLALIADQGRATLSILNARGRAIEDRASPAAEALAAVIREKERPLDEAIEAILAHLRSLDGPSATKTASELSDKNPEVGSPPPLAPVWGGKFWPLVRRLLSGRR